MAVHSITSQLHGAVVQLPSNTITRNSISLAALPVFRREECNAERYAYPEAVQSVLSTYLLRPGSGIEMSDFDFYFKKFGIPDNLQKRVSNSPQVSPLAQ